ncbi:hypothetical protein ES332_D05G197000v1 [Gossypium tomentosum]|uniref:Myb/SANT-like domain-containing protein n=1 Tax=Gossypium tomentosum TaxID=34277 RepID=A0A5D2KWZ9_GOSTO|nr:hypothetical protein ES332_D05G197000v1 [Gossypium tomentosum]
MAIRPKDDVLIDALLHQQSLGNRIDRVFTTMAYENMANELHEKIGIPIEKGLLKNRIKTLKHNFYECYDLFNCRSGFAWSPGTKMWTAKPELWKALAKSKPDAKKWMITRIANYDMLSWKYLKGSLKSIREAIKDVAEAIREGNVIAERGQPRHIFSLLQTLGPLFGCTAEGRWHIKIYWLVRILFSFISLEWVGKQGYCT